MSERLKIRCIRKESGKPAGFTLGEIYSTRVDGNIWSAVNDTNNLICVKNSSSASDREYFDKHFKIIEEDKESTFDAYDRAMSIV